MEGTRRTRQAPRLKSAFSTPVASPLPPLRNLHVKATFASQEKNGVLCESAAGGEVRTSARSSDDATITRGICQRRLAGDPLGARCFSGPRLASSLSSPTAPPLQPKRKRPFSFYRIQVVSASHI